MCDLVVFVFRTIAIIFNKINKISYNVFFVHNFTKIIHATKKYQEKHHDWKRVQSCIQKK